MKTLINKLNRLSFRSLRLRLILYLLLVGSVPLLFALIVFYQQSVHNAQREYEQFAVSNHALMTNRIERTLAAVAGHVDRWNAEPDIQELMTRPAESVSGMIDMARSKLTRQMNSDNMPVLDVCFSFFESDVSLCSDSSYLLRDPPRASGVRMIDTVLTGSGPLLRLTAPLYDASTKASKGYAVVLLDHSRLLLVPSVHLPVSYHALLNESGAMMVGAAAAGRQAQSIQPPESEYFVQSSRGTMISGRPIQLFAQRGMSVIRWEVGGYNELRSALARSAVLFFLLLALLSVTISFLFSRSITRPIQALRNLMKRAELGDLKAYWSLQASKDIDDLGQSYNQMLNRIEDLIKQVKIEESLKKEKEFEALQYQLNPHFLYNTLNTIKWVAKIHKTPQISEAVSALVRLLQASLGKKGDFLPLSEEASLVRDYMEIQTFRYGDEIDLTIDIDPVAGLCLVPKMILQPLVENAILHGLDQVTGREKRIAITAWIDRDLLMCQVADNGKGMDPELLLSDQAGRMEGVKEKMSGIGLRHIREKIKLYYGPDYKMLIFSKPNQGTTIRLSLPIHRSEES